jgi:hypothetical protein
MSAFELRPLSLGELLDRAFFLYRRNFWLLAGIMAFPASLMIPTRFFLLRIRGVPFPWDRPLPQTHAERYGLVFLFVDSVIYAVGLAATTNAVADIYLGRLSTIRGAYSQLRGRIWRAVRVTFAVWLRTLVLIIVFGILGVIIGFFLDDLLKLGDLGTNPTNALVPIGAGVAGAVLGFWISGRYTLSLPAVLLEHLKGRPAIRRSVQLSQGYLGRIFVALLLGITVTYAMDLLFQGPFYVSIAVMKIKGKLPTSLILALSVSGAIGAAITSPLTMIALVLIYYDTRIRKEAFDLQQLMSSLPKSNPTAPIP